LLLTFLETNVINNKITAAPIPAAIVIPILFNKPFKKNKFIPIEPAVNTTNATPKLAPELIPRTKGSANGFLKKFALIIH